MDPRSFSKLEHIVIYWSNTVYITLLSFTFLVYLFYIVYWWSNIDHFKGGIHFVPTGNKNNSAEVGICRPRKGKSPAIPTGKSYPWYLLPSDQRNTDLANQEGDQQVVKTRSSQRAPPAFHRANIILPRSQISVRLGLLATWRLGFNGQWSSGLQSLIKVCGPSKRATWGWGA